MEKTQVLTKARFDTKRLAASAMMVALAYVVMMVTRFPLMASAEFLKYDPKDVVLLIGAYIFGPMTGALMSLAVCFLEMVTVSESGPIGFLMNVVASIAFIAPAALVYRRRRTVGGAIAGLVAGVAAMTSAMLLWNYIITPIYQGWERELVASMLVPVFLPFNLIKGTLNAALVLVLYQPVVNALRRSHLLPALPDGSVRRSYHIGVLALGLFLLITTVALVLILTGTV